jgi:hypothetical protein
VFKRLCSPCHDIGQDAKIKLGPPLNGIEMPGTRMAFVGIKNGKDIADLWAYLKQFVPEYRQANARARSPGSGQWRKARLTGLLRGNARVQMR